MTTKAKHIEVADVREMLTGALDDIANLSRQVQIAAEQMQSIADTTETLAKMDELLAILQQAKLSQQRVEWEVDATTTYLHAIVRQQNDQ